MKLLWNLNLVLYAQVRIWELKIKIYLAFKYFVLIGKTKKMLSNFYKPTPKKWRQIGDSALLGCTSISGFIMTSPLTDTEKVWTVFILNILGASIKMFTNFFKSPEDPILPTEQNENNTSNK